MKHRVTLAALLAAVFLLRLRPDAQIPTLPLPHLQFQTGDVMVSLENGPVQWWLPNGTLNRTLNPQVAGTGEGMAFDAAGSLYVARWCIGTCVGGNTVERYDTLGLSHGAIGTGYDCSPHTIVFDGPGNAYVGQAGCTGTILKFAPDFSGPTDTFAVAGEVAAVFWMDLAADGCTMFYTSYGPNVKRYDLCTRMQLPDFNVAALPGGATQDLRVLPDGGVIVSSGQVIARLNAAGVLVQTYSAPLETFWSGLDLVGDGTFWAGNYESSNVLRFNLATGAVVSRITTGSPTHTVVGVRVKK
jgi:streptogramin lyase